MDPCRRYDNVLLVDNPLTVVTGAILFVFTFESLVRALGYRWSLLNGNRLLDSIDIVVVLLSCIVYLVVITTDRHSNSKIILFVRVIRFLRILKFAHRLRKWVGLNRRRYKKDGFDLDLTYITPSVIAMGLPAFGSEATYRNPIDDVVRFFNHYHKEQFLVFNLCAERSYDADLFGGHVERIPVEDHNPPSFDTLVQFLHRVEIFFDQNPNNVIAVHCKGGKGRTGVFISAWLRYRSVTPVCPACLVQFVYPQPI